MPLRCMLRTVRASCRAATATACHSVLRVPHSVSFSVHFVYSSKAVHVTEATALFAALSPSEQQQTEHNNNNNNNNYKLEHSNNCAQQQQQQQHKNDKNDSCRRQSIRNYFGQSIKEIYAEPPKSSWPRKVQNKAWAPLCVCVCVYKECVCVCAHTSSLFILENVWSSNKAENSPTRRGSLCDCSTVQAQL